MQLGKTVDYMVRCVLYLAQTGPSGSASRVQIVAATGVPDLYFRKLVQTLSRAGIVRTTRGPRGGYSLGVPAEALTLLRVVEAGSGDLCLNQCALDPTVCGRSRACAVHPVWQDIRGQVRAALARVTFAELARRQRAVEKSAQAGAGAALRPEEEADGPALTVPGGSVRRPGGAV
jgi:Rrf2 family protein